MAISDSQEDIFLSFCNEHEKWRAQGKFMSCDLSLSVSDCSGGGSGGGDDDDDDDDDNVKLRRWTTIISTPSNGSLQPRS